MDIITVMVKWPWPTASAVSWSTRRIEIINYTAVLAQGVAGIRADPRGKLLELLPAWGRWSRNVVV